MNEFEKVLKNSGYPYEVPAFITDEKSIHYWHGGNAVTIQYKDVTFEIAAIGDVRFTLTEKVSSHELLYVKDKCNSGRLGNELGYYIKDDNELMLLLQDNHPKYTAMIDDNNWWECAAIHKGVFVDLTWALDGYTLQDAIEEVLSCIDQAYGWVMERS